MEMSGRHYIVMRSPVLMEDEGHHHLAKVCHSRDEAERWIAAQADQYFKPGDYYILAESLTE